MRGGSHVEKATLANSGLDNSEVKDTVVEKCGLVNSDIIHVGYVKETAMFVGQIKDVGSVDRVRWILVILQIGSRRACGRL